MLRIIVYMYFRDNKQHMRCEQVRASRLPAVLPVDKPHIHASYNEHEAVVAIDGELLAGSLPSKQMKVLTGWLAFHEEEAYSAWNHAVQGESFDRIEPMR